jgi:DNA polymerase III alpha subunit
MSADIDIDFVDRSAAAAVIDHITAARSVTLVDGILTSTKHNTGIYLQPLPHDPLTKIASIDYKEAERRGYFKIDFLNATVYTGVKNEEHLLKLMSAEPIWELLEQDDFVDLLFHLHGYGHVLRQMKPRSVVELAAVLALIRPAKKHLIGQSWDKVMAEVWEKPETNDYYFKKSHAVSYAMAIIVQMNLICESTTD